MTTFYDSSPSFHEQDFTGLPIILEPEHEPTRPAPRRSYLQKSKPTYDGASWKGDSDLDDSDEELDQLSQLNGSTYDEKSTTSHLTESRFEGSNVSQLSSSSYDDIRSRASRDHADTMKEVQATIQVPTHPISSMQDAFAESMMEASGSSTPLERSRIGDAAARRKRLLDQDIDDETHAARWRQKPGQRYHELWKLMSQISFGIYLLLHGIAKDEDQVMNILQGHVDEVDEFLETTLEDFDLAQEDMEERLKFLQLPLENIVIFDAMLEDRDFRTQIVSGNERIEHVITRTAKAMNDALKDVAQGLNACKEFTIYLAREQEHTVWKQDRPDMQKVFEAMKGNVEGWYKAYVSLQTKGNNLGVALVQLGTIVAEMDRRAADVSRKQRFSITPSPTASQTLSPRQSRQMRRSMSRPLPSDPTPITPAIRAALPAFGLVDDREREPEPEPVSTTTNSSASSAIESMPEPDFILKPHTYSPVPSPSPRPPPAQAAPAPIVQTGPTSPEIKKKSSLRKRFSLRKKEVQSDITIKPTSPFDQPLEQEVRQSTRQPPKPSTWAREQPTPVNTPPSRGLDSAYCSDYEKPAHSFETHPALLPTPTSVNSPRIPQPHPGRNTPPPALTRDFVPSPRSDQQFFRPVNASPNSPLQRPWTAAPSNIMHIHSNSSSSNLRYATPAPSRLGDRRGAPSAMGMSVMTDVTMENGKKVKKKRSAFGWLKKQFSLSEEEKAAFEQRRRATDNRDAYQDRSQQRWLDGKRIR